MGSGLAKSGATRKYSVKQLPLSLLKAAPHAQIGSSEEKRSSCTITRSRRSTGSSTSEEKSPGRRSIFIGRRRASYSNDGPCLSAVSHYIPPSFPIQWQITEATGHVLQASWDEIQHGGRDASGLTRLTAFFDLFFSRLYIKSSLCEEFFHSMSFKKKSKLLMQCIRFVQDGVHMARPELMTHISNKIMAVTSTTLEYNLSPCLLSCFAETLVEAVAHFSSQAARQSVKEAWAHATAQVLALALHQLLKGDLTTSGQTAIGDCTVPGSKNPSHSPQHNGRRLSSFLDHFPLGRRRSRTGTGTAKS